MWEQQERKFKFLFNMFFTKRKDGQVVSFSEERPASVSDAHDLVELSATEAKMVDIKHAKQVRIENGQLVVIPLDEDLDPELHTLLEKFKKKIETKEDKDRVLYLLLQKSQIR